MTELTLLTRSQFSLRLNRYEMFIWLYIDKADCKAFRVELLEFTVIIRRTLYHRNSVYPYRMWLVIASVYVKD